MEGFLEELTVFQPFYDFSPSQQPALGDSHLQGNQGLGGLRDLPRVTIHKDLKLGVSGVSFLGGVPVERNSA